MVLSGYLSVLLHQEMPDPKQGTLCTCVVSDDTTTRQMKGGIIILFYEQQLEKKPYFTHYCNKYKAKGHS